MQDDLSQDKCVAFSLQHYRTQRSLPTSPRRSACAVPAVAGRRSDDVLGTVPAEESPEDRHNGTINTTVLSPEARLH
jgi:hypothetical protein